MNFAYSPCPNDTFTFYGLAAKQVSIEGYGIKVHHHDIEELNTLALAGKYEISKMSFHTWLLVSGRYRLLKAGNALGYGCGPVLVSRRKIKPEDLSGLRTVLPGEHTTAHLLFQLYCPTASQRVFSSYDRIFSEIAAGHADCGVVIHESRFLYEKEGFHKVCDLGEWWEKTTNTPIPLGAIAVRNDMPLELDAYIENAIRASLTLARAEPASAMPYIKQMAIETSPAVIEKHIKTFVNEFTMDLGASGMLAIAKLQEIAAQAGIRQ